MLSLAAMGSGSGDYYLGLAREDYYLEGEEPRGRWWGEGAKALHLSGSVKNEDLRDVLSGFSPGKREALVRNAGSTHHQGWDLTFSAPKSVSVLWSQAEPKLREALQQAHLEAVVAALDYLEKEASWTRRGKGGTEHERTVGIVVALFEHGTSRAKDPNLHTHALLVNAARRQDGTWGMVYAAPFFEQKLGIGALYRAELASRLEILGFEVERTEKGLFEAKGVPKELTDTFSKRRAEIQAAMENKGFRGAKAAAIAALDTRPRKEHEPRGELLKGWQRVGFEHGFSGETIQTLRRERPRDIERGLKEASCRALKSLTEKASYFSESDFVRRVAEEAPGRGLSALDVRRGASEFLGKSDDFVHLGKRGREALFTSLTVLAEEEKMLRLVRLSKETDSHALKPRELSRAISEVEKSRSYLLSAEQLASLKHIADREGSIQVVQGMAGTGKTAMLEAAKLAWEKSGYKVVGAALSGKAALELQEQAGIRSTTLAGLLLATEPKSAWKAYVSAHKAALRFWGFSSVRGFLKYMEKAREPSLRLDSKTVLVLDEAGMVSTPEMAKLVEKAHKAGAKLVVVGDRDQLQAIGRGGAFAVMGKELGTAELTDIRRQRETWAREAVKEAAKGRGDVLLKAFAERGLLSVEADRKKAMAKLISDWSISSMARPENALILAGTKEEVRELNRRAQQARLIHEKICPEHLRHDGQEVHTGDIVLFTKRSRYYGVENGTRAQVVELDAAKRRLTVKLADRSHVTLNLRDYGNLELGYALTTHKAQGATVERSYILLGGSMQDRHLSYVQASRAEMETRLYADADTAGENVVELAKAMSRDREKKLAARVQEELSREGRSLEHER